MKLRFRRISQELQRRRMNHWKSHPCKSGKANVKKMSNFPGQIPTTVVPVTRVNRTFLACPHESVRSDVKANKVIM